MNESVGETGRGWYLYGITRRGPMTAALVDAPDESDGRARRSAVPDVDAPLQLLECSELAAVVRPVPLADFSVAVLQERVRNASELETMVRGHNRVIEAVHARQAILPAKFGMVYADARDILSVLGAASDALVPRLRRLDGCDEWAFHLYVDREVVREHVAATSPAIARLHEERAAARPGRAYFLERQIRDEVEAATRDALVALAQSVFDRLAAFAVAGEVSPAGADADGGEEVEILRAAFLVSRDDFERFEAEALAVADGVDGLRAECSGPWPPYSFAAYEETAE